MKFIPMCKGKDLDKVPKSKLLNTGWYTSIKYDGNYIQIHKKGNSVKFYTSGGKEFYFEYIAKELIELNRMDFIIECEYIGTTDGKLGSRPKCSTGTYRANFKNNIRSIVPSGTKFKVFDVIVPNDIAINCKFKHRIGILRKINLGTSLSLASGYETSFDLDKINVDSFTKEGWEGLYLKHEDHVHEAGKRVNLGIKLKKRPTVDLLCIDVTAGEPGSKYEEMIGSLVLQDSEGRVVSVGSGLDDKDRNPMLADFYIGKVIEISYEQILSTYIQPVYVGIREDKTKEEIS